MRTIVSRNLCPVYDQTLATRSWLVCSHIGWLLSWSIAYSEGHLGLMLMALGTIVFSSLYHYTGAISVEIVDTLFSIVYLFLGPVLLVSAGASQAEWLFGIGVALLAFAIYGVSRRRRLAGRCDLYVGWHALWHVSASLLTTTIYAMYFGWLAF